MFGARDSLALVMLLAAAFAQGAELASPQRQDAVAERGAKVMPFALDKTLHVFDKTETGGVQQVVAKQVGDTEQVNLIRQHLQHIAASFAQGDFSGPARIHGDQMPVLAELSAGAQDLKIVYSDLPQGGQIVYASARPDLVQAIHRYFDAQLSDHGRHAVGGHQGHHP
ncbi:hypothetical protein [Methyloterricola oryzae]|uniref:hypothetical protein n=1 Tax=Methyloterricola oryzae TaxID=1495050 RepID=UPI00069CB827|nr:hypothetical protein [Methyloterricola oryzae]